jgi:hypothetical protein
MTYVDGNPVPGLGHTQTNDGVNQVNGIKPSPLDSSTWISNRYRPLNKSAQTRLNSKRTTHYHKMTKHEQYNSKPRVSECS